MMKFTIGIALLAFTLIVGGYRFSNNMELISSRENSVQSAQDTFQRSQQLKQSVKGINKRAIPIQDSQKSSIERMLAIGQPGPSFTYVGQPVYGSGDRSFYKYTYRIKGPATFEKAMAIVNLISENKGFTISKFCFACGRLPRNTDESLKMVDIEGDVYIYDPKAFK